MGGMRASQLSSVPRCQKRSRWLYSHLLKRTTSRVMDATCYYDHNRSYCRDDGGFVSAPRGARYTTITQ